jgi:hypothetical protein
MRLGKLQASGYVADAADDDVRDEVSEPTATRAPAVPEPVAAQPEQAPVSG